MASGVNLIGYFCWALMDSEFVSLPLRTIYEGKPGCSFASGSNCRAKQVQNPHQGWVLLTADFEWTSGYGTRFGVIYVDYTDDLARTPKQSLSWLQSYFS